MDNIPDISCNIINEQYNEVIKIIEKAIENYQHSEYDHIIDDDIITNNIETNILDLT